MPATIIPFAATREGIYVVLEAGFPGYAIQPLGVLLIDPATDRGWIRMRSDFQQLADPEEAEVLELLQDDMAARIAELGAQRYLAWLEDSLSNVLRAGARQAVPVDAFTRVLDRLYGEHVEPAPVQEYGTHVPLFSLRAAAGSLGEEMPSEAEGWVRPPDGVRITRDLFVAHVVGRSMEPRIPNGSLNLYRLHPAGSRQGKILLIQRFGVDESARYTVKRYTSRKVETGEDQWQHERIRLEPLNPEFEPWDAGPEDFAVVAEWLRVID